MSGFNSNSFQQQNLSVYLPYSSEVVIGSSNSVVSGQGAVSLASLSLQSTLGATVGTTLKANPLTSNYSLTYPAIVASNTLPYAQNTISYTSAGAGIFVPTNFNNVWNGSNLLINTQEYVNTGVTLGGKVSFPLLKGTGSNIFNTIYAITTTGQHTSSNVSGFVSTAVFAQSLSNVIVSAMGNAGSILAGQLLDPVPDGTVVNIQIVGI